VKKLSVYLFACMFFANVFTISFLSGMERRAGIEESVYELRGAPYEKKVLGHTIFDYSQMTSKSFSVSILLLEKNDPRPIESVSYKFLSLLSQKASPIIATPKVVHNVISAYQEVKENGKEFEARR